jgi:hypothetical protein
VEACARIGGALLDHAREEGNPDVAATYLEALRAEAAVPEPLAREELLANELWAHWKRSALLPMMNDALKIAEQYTTDEISQIMED